MPAVISSHNTHTPTSLHLRGLCGVSLKRSPPVGAEYNHCAAAWNPLRLYLCTLTETSGTRGRALGSKNGRVEGSVPSWTSFPSRDPCSRNFLVSSRVSTPVKRARSERSPPRQHSLAGGEGFPSRALSHTQLFQGQRHPGLEVHHPRVLWPSNITSALNHDSKTAYRKQN